MTREEKKLLLRDLCARLAYFTKVEINNEVVVLDSICDDDGYHFNFIGDDRFGVNIEDIKPYLFPMSSMTKEQKKEYHNLCETILDDMGHPSSFDTVDSLDYLYENHIDIRGLIPMGLANDATGLKVY